MSDLLRLRSNNKSINCREYAHGHLDDMHERLDLLVETPLHQPLPKRLTFNEVVEKVASHPLSIIAAGLILGFGLFHGAVQ